MRQVLSSRIRESARYQGKRNRSSGSSRPGSTSSTLLELESRPGSTSRAGNRPGSGSSRPGITSRSAHLEEPAHHLESAHHSSRPDLEHAGPTARARGAGSAAPPREPAHLSSSLRIHLEEPARVHHLEPATARELSRGHSVDYLILVTRISFFGDRWNPHQSGCARSSCSGTRIGWNWLRSPGETSREPATARAGNRTTSSRGALLELERAGSGESRPNLEPATARGGSNRESRPTSSTRLGAPLSRARGARSAARGPARGE